MEVNPPTHPECQKACHIRVSSIHRSTEFCGCYSYNNEAMLNPVVASLWHNVYKLERHESTE